MFVFIDPRSLLTLFRIVAAGAILFALLLAYMPELFGDRYQRWRGW